MAASLREFAKANNSETDPLQSCNQALGAIEMTDTRVSKMFAKSPKNSADAPRAEDSAYHESICENDNGVVALRIECVLQGMVKGMIWLAASRHS